MTKEQKAAYQKTWKAKNAEHVRKYNSEYQRTHPYIRRPPKDPILAKERIREYQRRYREKNKNRIALRQLAYQRARADKKLPTLPMSAVVRTKRYKKYIHDLAAPPDGYDVSDAQSYRSDPWEIHVNNPTGIVRSSE